MDVIIWAVLLVIFIVLELCTVQLVSIWLAAGAFVAMICAFFSDSIGILGQVIIFIVSSAIFLLLSIPLIRMRQKKLYIATNSELNVGEKALVIEDIDPAGSIGRVRLNGVDWNAGSENGEIIRKNTTVTVTAVSGTKLIVKTGG